MTGKRRIKSLVKLITPPLLILAVKELLRQVAKPEWQYVPEGWKAAAIDPAIKGWSQQSVLDTYVAKWPSFVENLKGSGLLGLSPEADAYTQNDLSFHNMMMSYSYALNIAAIGKSSLSMLDWGGGIGHYYLISQALRSDLELNYVCKDLPLFADYGEQLLPEVTFYKDDRWQERKYDFVLGSGSLQYSEDWRSVLTGFAKVTSGYVFITRLPVVHNTPSYVMVQRPYAYGYNTEYLGWCLNRAEVISFASTLGLTLVREFIIEAPPYILNAPEQCDYWGFLWQKVGK